MNKHLYLMMILGVSSTALAAEQQAKIQKGDNGKPLAAENNPASEDTILVRSTPTSQTMGTQIITSEQIKRTPTRNGSVTELLRNNPNVRFSNSSDSSQTPGELQPENVSFHGEKFYQNNYMIDGLSNNNVINPGANNGELSNTPDGYSPTDLPAGGAQSFWINSELIEQLQVFDSNISAKYGDFTGGVVDAKLKDPKLDRASGRIAYRTTRDSWASYHIDDDISSDFFSASQLYYQPKFTKNFYSVSINQPLSDKAGFIFAYNRQQSTIPFYNTVMGDTVSQTRQAETYLLKGTYLADNGDILRLTGMYAPHESRFYKKDIKNGGFTNTGGGYRGNIEWEHNTDWGKVTSLAGYQFEENRIEHESDSYQSWYRYNLSSRFISNVIDWGSGVAGANAQLAGIGGYGKYATEKQTVTLKQDYELNPLALWGTSHQLDMGWQVDSYQARYRRFNDVYSNRGTPTISKGVACRSGDDFCIGGEQYYRSRNLYPARQVQGDYLNYAMYLQDSVSYKRLEVTPGVRLQYDDYLKNLNIAPRLAASYDVFGDRSTRLFGGVNRYYAQNMLAYKLRSGISESVVQSRTSASGAWSSSATGYGSNDYDISDLKTPYSDELSLGLSQRVYDTVWTLKWVNRQGREQFGRSNRTDADGQRYYYLTNDARTQGNTFSLEVEPVSPYKLKYADIGWKLSASKVDNKSSSQIYYDQSNQDDSKVIFKGQLTDRRDMDALDYNTPWEVALNLNTYFPALRLNWDHHLAYTSGYTGYRTRSITCSASISGCGDYTGAATQYTDRKYHDYVSYDWRFNYSVPTFKNQSLDLTVDVINVFDNVIATSQETTGDTVTYKLGRQFWLGVAYNW
ncbi:MULTISPECIES: TonB-dependent receptor plug domain-containing protein [Dickeya]|uniref:Ton-B dependent hemine receptor n=1 Tax=Dickeya aquatica TaxID=1401087 RepID=A0A375A7B7_9GAMM|nr:MULTISPECIES: TonB-dependent receptor plug domain-containing protein [Dickeya]SLM61915.1 Putative Ton-B dependent hemine receptor [Dickeya aquatica]